MSNLRITSAPAAAAALAAAMAVTGWLVSGVPSPAAAADAVTCNGREATVTLTGDGDVYRTPSDVPAVVVVASGSFNQVLTGNGDDAVCVLAGADVTYIVTGAGNDFVSTTGIAADPQPSFPTSEGYLRDVVVRLGTGDDTFVGGPAFEDVAGEQGNDTISTNDGDDTVYATGQDTIQTGPGSDTVDTQAATGTIDLGDGDDDAYADDASVVALVGGLGADRLHLVSSPERSGEALVDLESRFFGYRGRPVSQVTEVEDLTTSGLAYLRVRGSDEANDISVQGCQAVIGAAGGDDSVRVSLERCASKTSSVAPGYRPVSFKLRGGPGADHLGAGTRGKLVANGGPGDDVVSGGRSDDIVKGGSGNDRLTGNGGFDTARGGKGHDTCRAERRLTC